MDYWLLNMCAPLICSLTSTTSCNLTGSAMVSYSLHACFTSFLCVSVLITILFSVLSGLLAVTSRTLQKYGNNCLTGCTGEVNWLHQYFCWRKLWILIRNKIGCFQLVNRMCWESWRTWPRKCRHMQPFSILINWIWLVYLVFVLIYRRVAQELGVRLGEEVGYAIRFEDRTSEKPRIKYDNWICFWPKPSYISLFGP